MSQLPAPVTTRRTPKKMSWSFSKLKNWRSCPRRHSEIDLQKKWQEESESDAIKYGNLVHKLLEDRIVHGKEIPEMHRGLLEPQAQRVLQGHANAEAFKAATGNVIYGEQQLAITENFQACEWFDKKVHVWHRSKMDILKIAGPVALAIDWKTGKITQDSEQLLIASQCIFAHYPQVQAIRTLFVWLKEDADTDMVVRREHMPALWAKLLPELGQYADALRENNFPPRPSGLCQRWCPVLTCEHCGKGDRHGY